MKKNFKRLLANTTPKQKGFSLIELLVAMVITGIMMTLVMGSYWTFLKTQQRMTVSRELQSEVRFAFNRLADSIRSSTINYAAYLPGGECVNHNHQLCLIKPNGDTYFVAFDDTNKQLKMGENSTNAQFLLSPQKFSVDNIHFNVSPTQDPKVDLSRPQQQPKVTFFLRVFPNDARYSDLIIENQTTISSRQY